MKPLNVAEDGAQQRVKDAIARGLADVVAGRTLTDAASEAELDEAFGLKRRSPIPPLPGAAFTARGATPSR